MHKLRSDKWYRFLPYIDSYPESIWFVKFESINTIQVSI